MAITLRWTSIAVFCSICAAVSYSFGQDLRKQFGTNSVEVANALNQGIQLVRAKKPDQGMPHIERAIRADPNL